MHHDASWNKSSWAVLGAALLILLYSAALTLYRASLPTDGREWLDSPQVEFYFGDETEIESIEGLSVDEVIHGAITLQPRRPSHWAVGQSVTYTLQDGGSKSFTLERSVIKLMDWSNPWQWLALLILLLQLLLGSFVFLRRPDNQATRLLFLFGIVLVSASIHNSVTNKLTGLRLTDYFHVGAYWPTLLFYCLESALLPLLLHFFLVFPDIKRPIRSRPRLTWLLYASTVFDLGSDTPRPLTWLLGEWAGLLALIWFLTMLVGIVISAGHTVLTLRRATGGLKMRWVAWAVTIPLVYFTLLLLFVIAVITIALCGWQSHVDPLVGKVVSGLLSGASAFSFLAFPVFLMVAVLRYRLFGIDVLLNRTLVYGALTGFVAGLYVLVVGALGAFFHTGDSLLYSVLTTGLIAVLFQPLRERLQRGVNRLMYGERDEPVTVLSRLGQRLEAVLSTESVLPTIVETVAQALRLPYVAISLQPGDAARIAAEYGQPVSDILSLPLTHQGEMIGRLLLAPRAPGEAFTPGDLRLLESVAQQTGTAAHAVRLTADLQRSRERLVLAREEERRRLRRDLHDDLGPQLAGLTLKLDAARNLLARDPQAASQLLVELKTQAQAAISDVRRLVYDLRPPALDQLGLVPALQAHAATHNTPSGLRVVVESPDAMPPLPAAVEVAAYRIAMEALTNTARHAQARHCWVHLTLDDGLRLEVSDDGVGLPGDYQAGVGLASMHERAAELGGTCVIEPRVDGGTRVLAWLPLATET